MEYAEKDPTREGGKYFVLLVITSGLITDMEKTIDVIVEAANFPISIVVVGAGVGKEDFTDMHTLDADDTPLVGSNGKNPSRDIVHFVEFSHFLDSEPSEFAGEILREIPDQLVDFMTRRGIRPTTPPPPYIPPSTEKVQSDLPPPYQP
jgi:hypothetical protein